MSKALGSKKIMYILTGKTTWKDHQKGLGTLAIILEKWRQVRADIIILTN